MLTLTATLLLVLVAAVTIAGHMIKGWPLYISVLCLVALHVLNVLPR